MRKRDAYKAIREAMYRVMGKTSFRILHLSIQKDHVHLICEAADKVALARGIQGFKVSAAKRLNKALGRTGAIFGGWTERGPVTEVPSGYELLPSAKAQTWLANVGWRKAGTISLLERPGQRPT